MYLSSTAKALVCRLVLYLLRYKLRFLRRKSASAEDFSSYSPIPALSIGTRATLYPECTIGTSVDSYELVKILIFTPFSMSLLSCSTPKSVGTKYDDTMVNCCFGVPIRARSLDTNRLSLSSWLSSFLTSSAKNSIGCQRNGIFLLYSCLSTIAPFCTR